MGLKSFIDRHDGIRTFAYRQAVNLLVRPLARFKNVPIIAVTGTNGKSTVCKLLHRLYRRAGYRVGMCTTDGVYVEDRLIQPGDQAGANGVWRALRGQKLDLLIAETARGGILRYGIGFDKCQVAVATNISNDHLGFEGVETLNDMAGVKARVLRRVVPGGTVVLNLDDGLVRTMPRPASARVIGFTLGDRPEQAGDVFYVHHEAVWQRMDQQVKKVVPVRDIALTWNGLHRHHLANVLAALGAVQGMSGRWPVPEEVIREGLADFGKSPGDNLYRSTLLRYQGALLLLSFCQNEEGYRNEVRCIAWLRQQYGVDRVVGLLTGTGWKREEDFATISRIVAPACEIFRVTLPDPKLQGKWSAEELVGLLSSAIPAEKIRPFDDPSLAGVMKEVKKRADELLLFVVFEAPLEPRLDVEAVLAAAEPVRPWSDPRTRPLA